MRFIVSFCVFICGMLITAIVMSVMDKTPDTFYEISVPWAVIAVVLYHLPKKTHGFLLLLCYFSMASLVYAGIFILGGNVIDYFNQEPDKVCSYDCPQPIPDTSDLNDLVTPTGDNNHSPGTHNVDGHYRGGTYVEPYIRSNPDGDPSNNIND